MHLFKRGRKESNGPSSSSTSSNGSPSKHSGSKIVSASLPSSSSSSSLKHATYHGGLPPVPEKATTLRPAQQHHASSPAMYISEKQHGRPVVNEFGAMSHQSQGRTAPPAFLKDTPATSYSNGSYLKPLPAVGSKITRRMSTGSVPSIDGLLKDTAGDAEMQLCYGYWPIETQRELSLAEIEEVVRLCGQEIRTRGIEAPMLFSTQALDISLENITSLIRAYVSDRNVWKRDLRLANSHDLSGMIKWALGRYVNPQGSRGFLLWETYERWRFGEREKEFPNRYITTNMLYHLPTQNATLLTTLLSLLCSALAYTTKNGCTIRKLATLFSSYIFGLPDDGTFEHTYTAFNRFSHGTEHLLLAYIRNELSSHVPGSGAPSTVPLRLQELVTDYPKCLPVNLNKPPSGVNLQQVVRIRRLVRFYSRNLVQSAGTWEVPRSQNWALAAPFPHAPMARMNSPKPDEDRPSNFLYTSKYRHLLAIRTASDVHQENSDELHKYGSSVQKEWVSFLDNGFAPPDQNKLRFDLTESDRQARQKKHETIDWSSFESSGFAGRETFLGTDLSFVVGANDLNKHDDLLSEQHKKLIAAKAKAFEKTLPPFTWDIQPREERSIQVDKQFFEVFSDVLCSSGWTRDEMKESNWALVQYKTRPKDLDKAPSPGKDGRTTETWYLVEEIVPAEYRAALLANVGQNKPKTSRRVSFLRAVRLKPSKPPPMPVRESPPPVSSLQLANNSERSLPHTPQKNGGAAYAARSPSPALKHPDESLFSPGSGGPPTKVVTLSKSLSSAGMSTSSTRADDDAEVLHEQQPVPPGPTIPTALPRVSTDSRAEGSIASSKGGGLGYTKPSSAEKTENAFMRMVRKTTRRGSVYKPNPLLDTGVNRSRLEIDSPNTLRTPGSSTSVNFDVQEHGVSGSGQSVQTPTAWMDVMAKQQQASPALNAQRASPSFSGTARTVDSAATAGHGSSGGTARPRDLPAPPSADEGNRLTTASAMEADAIVESYGDQSNPLRASTRSSLNPYDGMAEDDGDTVQDHETLVVPANVSSGQAQSPNGDTVWRGSQYEDQQTERTSPPKRSSSLSDHALKQSDSGVGLLSPERPRMYFKGHPSQEVMPEENRLNSPTSPEGAPTPPSKA